MNPDNNSTKSANTFDLNIQQVKRTLLDAAHAAALITLPAFRSGLSVDNKEQASFDPVTEADRSAELAIRTIIERDFPDHAIIGEEFENKITDSPFSWVIDPIDGTRSFISGIPMWGTLIGLAHQHKTFAGIMTQPFTDETYLGLPGATAYSHRETEVTISTSNITELGNARLFTTTPSLFKGEMAKAYNELESKVRLQRYGCDCYAYCMLAGGHVDLVVETGLKIYDIAALIPIVRNAGGVITNFEGNEPDDTGNIIAAATSKLHQQTVEIMKNR